MDQTTRSALRAFQTDQGLDVTGELDEATKSALGMVPVDMATAQSSSASVAGDNNSTGTNDTASPSDRESDADEAVEEDEEGGWSLF